MAHNSKKNQRNRLHIDVISRTNGLLLCEHLSLVKINQNEKPILISLAEAVKKKFTLIRGYIMIKNILIKSVVVTTVALTIASCATKAKKIEAAYVSPIGYESYTCDQLGLEAQRVSARAAALSGQQDQQAKKDAVAVGVSLVLFWPAAFLVKGDNSTAAEISRLKGEMSAIEQVSTQKQCGFQFNTEGQSAT